MTKIISLFENKVNLLIILFALFVIIAGLVVLLDQFGLFGDKNDLSDKNSAAVPILMYHHFVDEGNPGTVISAEMFDKQLAALRDAGFTAISFEELCAFVYDGVALPKRPIIITIDDGYMSVYETAFPILRKYNMKATVFIIGVSHGRSLYKGTQYPIIPRFDDAEAREMVESGIISIQSHSYDMHQHEPYETGPFRTGVLQMDGESREEYIQAFSEDFRRASAQIEAMLGTPAFVYSYPFGRSSDLSEELLHDFGVTATLTIVEGVNTVVRDTPESLFLLKRFNVPGDMTPEELLAKISG